MRAVKWTRPHHFATAGGESSMIRFLDDPDLPCYTGNWYKPDKNRFHQDRAPGGPKQYVHNPALWVDAFRASLSAVSIAGEWPYPGNSVPGEGWGCKRGTTLISPRHVLHSHGGLGVGTLIYPTRFRFVGTDGVTYERAVIGGKSCDGSHPVTVNGVSHTGDVTVLTLSSALPPAVVPIRCIPDSYHFQADRYPQWDALFVSQSLELDATGPTAFGEQANWYPVNEPFPANNYPRRHRSMCGYPWSSDTKVGYRCWGGDSGMPTFVGVGTELLLKGFAGGGGQGADTYPKVQANVTITWEALVNAVIGLSDADAIARGSVMTVASGYTVSIANDIIPFLPR